MKKLNKNYTLLILGVLLIVGSIYFMNKDEDESEKCETTPKNIHVGYWDTEKKHVYCRDSDGNNQYTKGSLQLFDEKNNSLINLVFDYCYDKVYLAEFHCIPETSDEDTFDIFYNENEIKCDNQCLEGMCI